MNLTLMMINDKARGRRGKNAVQEHADCSGLHTHTHTASSGLCSNKVMDEAYRRINVSMCLMSVQH